MKSNAAFRIYAWYTNAFWIMYKQSGRENIDLLVAPSQFKSRFKKIDANIDIVNKMFYEVYKD